LVSQQHPVDQQLMGVDDWFVNVQPPGHRERLARLLVGAGDAIQSEVRAADRDLPGTAVGQPAQFAVHELPEIIGGVRRR
jgi:hypothetical protein